jgi:hypothetical protein
MVRFGARRQALVSKDAQDCLDRLPSNVARRPPLLGEFDL